MYVLYVIYQNELNGRASLELEKIAYRVHKPGLFRQPILRQQSLTLQKWGLRAKVRGRTPIPQSGSLSVALWVGGGGGLVLFLSLSLCFPTSRAFTCYTWCARESALHVMYGPHYGCTGVRAAN